MIKKVSDLKLERIARGLGQGGISRKTGIPQSYLSHFESGRMVPSRIEREKLAEALGVSLEKIENWLPKRLMRKTE